MANDPKDTSHDYPALGRWLTWVDKPGSATKLFRGLGLVCLLVALADFTYKKYGHFDMELIPNFYGFYGFVMFTGLILLAKGLRRLVGRAEDYYGDKAIDREDYPEAGTDKRDHGDV